MRVRARRFGGAAVALLVAGVVAATGTTRAAAARGWVGGWEAAVTAGGPAIGDRTVRMVVHTTAAGHEIRLRLTNRYGTEPLVVGAVRVAVRASGADAVPGTGHAVTFDRARGAVVAAGADRVSDPVALTTTPDEDLLVSVYLPAGIGAATVHADAEDTTYLSTPGDHTRDRGTAYRTKTTSWYLLSGLDVLDPASHGTLVAFGDSVTDGVGSGSGTNARWPDDLARRLGSLPGGSPVTVVDAGIGGNRVLTDAPARQISFGVSALHRFERDALGEPRVTAVVLLEGINDIGNNAGPHGRPLTLADLVHGYRTLIAEAHAAHVRVYGGTLLPYRGAGYWTPAGEVLREAVNHWILTSGAFDGTIDFAAAVADPAAPQHLRAGYDSGDHLHPDAAGYQAMADAVDLAEIVPTAR
jgi:lysophospholipase L1-like esterase